MKISSKREGDEADIDSYNAIVPLQNEDASKDAEFNSSEGGSELAGPDPVSQQTILRSAETGSNPQQNQSFQAGTKSTFNDGGSVNSQGKTNFVSANSSSSSQTQQITGSQPKSNSNSGPSSSHETQLVNQGIANNNQKLEDNTSTLGGSTRNKHTEPSTPNLEVNKTSMKNPNALNFSDTSKGKTGNSNFSQPQSETIGTK